ncbi:hypothetical protein BpHYR1_032314 [Brachionus plicatilis]|uniref:Uncharacterized protein n=1 Tax=Brachionus plicatilis TaxID=10195 RepID=A0A3M7RB53_BRAPC|nr:hypothetical protein BpHYR1_032314 [Brachionus plicatilis]
MNVYRQKGLADNGFGPNFETNSDLFLSLKALILNLISALSFSRIGMGFFLECSVEKQTLTG